MDRVKLFLHASQFPCNIRLSEFTVLIDISQNFTVKFGMFNQSVPIHYFGDMDLKLVSRYVDDIEM